MNYSTTTTQPEPTVGVASVDEQPESRRYPFHIAGTLFLPLECGLPTDTCVCCSKPAFKSVRKSLRNPKSPLTWYSRVPKVEIGLCRKHSDDRGVAYALTYSALALGFLLVGVGIYTFSISMMAVGLLAMLASGIFRARESIQGRDQDDEVYEISGACDSFVLQFPEHELVED